MSEIQSTYRVVFWGDVAEGQTQREVVLKFARQFGIRNPHQLQRLFCGRVVTLKRGLSESDAQRYGKAIRDLGAICRMEREVCSVAEAVHVEEPKARVVDRSQETRMSLSMAGLQMADQEAVSDQDEDKNPFGARDVTAKEHPPHKYFDHRAASETFKKT